MKIVQEASELAGAFNLGDYVPILAPLDLQGLTKRIELLSKAFDDMLESIILDHEQGTHTMNDHGHAKMNFTDILLSIKSNTAKDLSQAIDKTSMKALLTDLVVGAADASITSIEWVLSALIRHPRVMKKVQQEIKEVVGNKMFVDEADFVVVKDRLMERRIRVTTTKFLFGFIVSLYTLITYTHPANTISPNVTITYNQSIVSSQQTFELGFFRPGTSMNYYLGIWYKKIPIQTVVWVANPNTPLTDASNELTLTLQGILILTNTTGNVIWSSTNSSTKMMMRNPIGKLLDNGNFIIYDEGDDNINNQEDPIWQSFDFMTNTLLPGMKLGWNFDTKKERHLTSWTSENDPAFGEFSYLIDKRGYPQAVLKKGTEIVSRGGPWNGLRYTGSPNLEPNRFYNFTFVLNEKQIYYEYDLVDTSVVTIVVLQSNGVLERLLWIDREKKWNVYLSRQSDRCDTYGVCGPFGSCNSDKFPVCECLKGFEPASPQQWKITDWSQGCRHVIPLDCDPAEGFKKYSNLKLPDTRGSWYNQTMTLEECQKMCKRNCSCSAYTRLNISGTGSGCLLWFGNLTDIRRFAKNGDTLYIRLSASELGN
ncbi:hypothetical protein QVD17_02848 [Tagetes erecta]|uniref:non-specific serine/threonine protein kinase n=1 Tax=Tagetes erecta TaxID=13708 RepID=A0AAD8LCE6_TARER|nr:hypothetical protein QVD17_02848 [Tagetes erecta]